jgi:type VI secretion system secreted protein VgrG
VDELLLHSFNGVEGISKLFHFDLTMHSENRSIQFDSIVGKKATVTVFLPDGSKRHINGIISSFSQGGSSPLEDGTTPTIFASYYATLVPWLWALTRTSDCRIFQNMSAPDIIAKVFKEHGFSDFANRLYGAFEPREYCVQYRETDFNFVSRLMEEEGIFYFFEHSQDKHVLVLANRPNEFKPSPLHPDVSYKSIIGEKREHDVINEWYLTQEQRAGKYTLVDYNFQQPLLDLTATVTGKDERKLEIYDYPGEYREKGQGERLVGLRMEEEQTPLIVISGAGTCAGFTPGYRFDLRDHYRRDFNKSYVLTSVNHWAVQGSNYRSTAEQAAGGYQYANRFQCLPHPTAYRPARVTPTPVVRGSQTAIVVGPAGEEIYVDKYGRVKVQFHWDREGKYNENSSCWMRVSQNWAGKRWGAMFIPRIGQEVIVDFLEGDPDQPIITGRVYNGDSMPPYELPGEKTKSAIKSNSTKGGEGFNEIRFEDKKGEEQVFIHAEKQQDNRVKKDSLEWVGGERHLIVKQDQMEEVEGDKHLQVKGNQNEKVDGTVSLKAGMDMQQKVGMKAALDAGMEIHLKSGMNLVIESGVTLTLKVGGNFINLNPAGVFIQGTMVMINSGGAAGSGSGASPEAPKDPKEADKADPGEKPEMPPPKTPVKPTEYQAGALALKQAAASGMPFTATGTETAGSQGAQPASAPDPTVQLPAGAISEIEGQPRFPKSWNKFDPSHNDEFKTMLSRFRASGNLEPNFSGGEGRIFLSERDQFLTLKRWFQPRLGDMDRSIQLLRDAKIAVDSNPRLKAVIEVTEIHEEGSDWIKRDFDPTSMPLRDAIDDASASAARTEAISALEGTKDPVLKKMSEKIKRQPPSENIHWSPDKGKILIIDMQ